jgi:hypothetical protein
MRALAIDPPRQAYVCVVCRSPWEYAEIRNIARCPTCNGGLVKRESNSAPTAALASLPTAHDR